ncbi:MAG: GNAT family N-acetyltransferase [Phycisphaerales bacterium]
MPRHSATVRKFRPMLVPPRPLHVDSPGVLRTLRLALRPLTSRDRKEFIRVLELDAAHLAPLKFRRDGETAADLFERQLILTEEGERTGRAWRRAAFLADGRLVGCFNLGEITRGLCFTGLASWWVSPDLTGRGYATEGVRALVDHATTDLPFGIGLHTVRAHIQAGNTPSRSLAARIGMKRLPNTVQISGPQGWEAHEVWEISVQ